MRKRVVILGGSPCSGKSTVAERVSKEYGAYYYKVDDRLSELIEAAARQGKPACKAVRRMSPEEIWMRTPELQCREAFQIYEEIAPFVFAQIDGIDAELILAEGAAYTPAVMRSRGMRDYITIIPTPEFQISHYRERPWVPRILAGCSDKDAAFANWMQRDILFAAQVKTECAELGVPCIVNDGSESIDRFCQRVIGILAL